jgi:predicted cupin superfamily sugar epimerase
MRSPAQDLSADEIIRLLGLAPHPEGGHFRETFRDAESDGARAASTAIYFLLREGEVSRWHRVDAAEVWHWYAGAPLSLSIADDAGRRDIAAGIDLAAGERPQAVVPVARLAAGAQPGRLDAGRLHGCARVRVRRLRNGPAGIRSLSTTSQ